MVLSVAMPQYIVAKDTLPINKMWPTTCYLGMDVAKTCVGWYQKTGCVYEINGSIDFSHILLDLDYGFGTIQRDHRQDNGSFASANGRYCRIGLGYNFLTPTVYHNQFFIGCRYARSFFDFQLESNKLQCKHLPAEPCRPACTAPAALQHRKDVAIAHWWEFVAGGKVYLMSILSIGCTARYKFSKKIENKLATLPFDIPGFGLAEFDHAFGYSLYILMRLPLQKPNKACYQSCGQKSAT